jgi:hypothetical protein
MMSQGVCLGVLPGPRTTAVVTPLFWVSPTSFYTCYMTTPPVTPSLDFSHFLPHLLHDNLTTRAFVLGFSHFLLGHGVDILSCFALTLYLSA